jgi:hypothetical protein
MRRREFLGALGGAAAAWPVVARAQQAVMPMIGFLNPASPDAFADRLRGFRQGLKETGTLKVKMWRSNIGGLTVRSIGCQSWRPT